MRIPFAPRVIAMSFGLSLALGCKGSERNRGTPPPTESAGAPQESGSVPIAPRTALDYSKPALDLPAERLSERVNGGEPKLRKLGCRRLRLWRLTQLPADLELLSFASEQGAVSLLADLAGAERSPQTPGGEGWIGTNVLYFRRGTFVVRLVADGPECADSMLTVARELDRAMAKGEIFP